jgi:NAD(P)-dependent dehydrogenase (short-subunit alcohol dehydrogenase family)
MTDTLHEKVALITGANSGLGKATAIGLARAGFTVVVTARSRERGEAAQREIANISGGQVELLLADLSSQAQIRALAAEFLARHDRINLLVNNAGNSYMTRQLSPDGIELSLAVNHLASFLLTHLLLDALQAGAPARIVNVGTRLNTAMDFDDLQWERRPYRGLSAYAQSKLGNLHFTLELAERLAGTGVTVNCVHPGVFRSNLGRNAGPMPRWMEIVTGMSRPFLPSAEKAAERVLHVALAPGLDGVSGRYFGLPGVELQPPPQALDRVARERLWAISSALVGLPMNALSGPSLV